ncbi:M24 family metallopeptidase [Melioribacteraceae bacterium 4301-Me]|uniref:M24 family metallopeptidase n=1 Tax=Pyranulibacter aquaticus TaxID=3163344 RepID=UPI0035967F03
MKNLNLLLISLFVFLLMACNNQKNNEKISKAIWKGLPSQLLTDKEINDEINAKIVKLKKWLKENNLAGMLFTQVRNVNWITAGKANTQIVLNKDVGAASLLIMENGNKYLIANGSEAPRLLNEGLKGLGYELKFYPWYETNPIKDVRGKLIAEIAGNRKIGSDIPYPNTILMDEKFQPLRYELTPTEIKRYRWLSEQTTEAVAEVCKSLMPGMDEYEIEAMTAAEIRSRGIMPTVLLIGVDQRIYGYRHALPYGAKLKKYAMINVVAEKWGMPVAVTRFVHFGPLPADLQNKIEKTAIVHAHYEEATKPGVSCASIFEEMKKWYEEVGFKDEWKKHHQGGAIGYNDREYIIYPDIKEVVHENQAFAWNPTITGAKVEETILVHKDSVEVLTKAKDWPMINVELNGKVYPQPDILIRDPKTGEIVSQPIKKVKL